MVLDTCLHAVAGTSFPAWLLPAGPLEASSASSSLIS